MTRLILVLALLCAVGCKNTAEQLRDEGYTNIVSIDDGSCPSDDPDRHEGYRAERDGKTWEITVCCHHYWLPHRVGKVTTIQQHHSCSRYTKEVEP